MNNKTKQKLNDAGYTFKDLGYGIDIFKDRYTGGKMLAFHGHEVEIIHWLTKNGEWD